MPRRQDHAGLSLIIIAAIYFIFSISNFSSNVQSQFFISSFLLVIGSLLPDILEPAYDYNHREFFHSRKLLFILIVAATLLMSIWVFLLKSQYFLYTSSLLLGYILHLLLDSFSKIGLPSK